jgi:hypothetical protein
MHPVFSVFKENFRISVFVCGGGEKVENIIFDIRHTKEQIISVLEMLLSHMKVMFLLFI